MFTFLKLLCFRPVNILIYCFGEEKIKIFPFILSMSGAACVTYQQKCAAAALMSLCVCVWLVNADAPPHPHPFVTLLLISSRRKPYFGLSVSSVQPRRHRSRSPRFPCWSNRQIIRRSNTGSSLLLYVYTIRPPFFCPPSFISFSLSEVILTKRWLWLISPRWFLLIFFRWMF